MVMTFNATFNNISTTYIMAVSFNSGGNRRKLPTCHKSPINFITCCWIEDTSPRAGFD